MFRSWPRAAFVALMMCLLALTGCHNDDETGSFPADNRSDCLPNVSLLDQNGHSVNVSSHGGFKVPAHAESWHRIPLIWSRCRV